MNLKLLFIFVCVLISMVLFGCKNEGIKFYRESGVEHFMNDMSNNHNSTTTKSSSGVVIYKDNSTTDSTSGKAHFGPNDLNFDINIK